MGDYTSPALERLGTVEQLTQGRHFSSVDGNSGTVGNRGKGKGRKWD